MLIDVVIIFDDFGFVVQGFSFVGEFYVVVVVVVVVGFGVFEV